MICCAILALLAGMAAIPATLFGRARRTKSAHHCPHEMSPSPAETPADHRAAPVPG